MTAISPSASRYTAADLVSRFGAIPLWRIRHDPPPGVATEADVIRIAETEDRLCELVDGVLVEKPIGYEESVVAATLIGLLTPFVSKHRLGVVARESGMMRLAPGLIRIPDISFVSRRRFPDGKRPRGPIAGLAPDLAIEVLSVSNTRREMTGKRIEYFAAGAIEVWFVDLKIRSITVFLSPDNSKTYGVTEFIDGGSLLPGFRLLVADAFADLE
ncbi:MAG: Uma2 family endonuclease [Planctomycetota bacterium]|nr:Uma2 family endonuclease [Planctomycetota bacterium]